MVKQQPGLASEMIDVSNDFDKERKALLNGTKGHYIHEFTKKDSRTRRSNGKYRADSSGKSTFIFIGNDKCEKWNRCKNERICVHRNEDIKDIYRKQYPNDTKTVDVNKMRKILNKEFSRHRIYFDGDFGYKNQLDELEHWKMWL